VGEFVVTGSKVYIEGKLQTSSWEDRQSGQTKYRTEIVARDLVLLGSRGNGTGDSQENHPGPAARYETHNRDRRESRRYSVLMNDACCSAPELDY
jgi:single-strand DNA-binding protein